MTRRVPSMVLLVSALITVTASPCGGPGSYRIDAPLLAVQAYITGAVTLDDLEGTNREELRFLYPFRDFTDVDFDDSWDLAYGVGDWGLVYGDAESPSRDAFVRVNLDEFYELVSAGDLPSAERAARDVIDAVLDMHTLQAGLHQQALRRAVEFVEVAPHLAGVPAETIEAFFGADSISDALDVPTVLDDARAVRRLSRVDMAEYADANPDSPRIASLRYVALQETLKRDIPNGWPHDIREQMTPEAWDRLHRLHDEWLAAFGQHPLADLVSLSRARLHYFAGEPQATWRTLLDVYPRRLTRVVSEMRYLLLRGVKPDSTQVASLDPLLLTALMPTLAPSSEQWSAWWQLTEQADAGAWSVNLQERLLERAAYLMEGWGALPFSFPKVADNPTPLWGELRLLALFHAQRWAEARAQAASLSPTHNVAAVTARMDLFEQAWVDAVAADSLGEYAAKYLIRVIVPEDGLVVLSQSADTMLVREATVALAGRSAARGDWAEAAQLLDNIGRPNADDWAEAMMLASDTTPGGRLRLGRFMAARSGELFYGNDIQWYRSLNWRQRSLRSQYSYFDSRLPWAREEEHEAIRVHLLATTEMYVALEAYADYLASGVGSRDDRRAVVQEADRAYNWLINWDNTNSSFWLNELQDGEAAQTIRRVGRER